MTFLCFGTPIWPPLRHMKMLYSHIYPRELPVSFLFLSLNLINVFVLRLLTSYASQFLHDLSRDVSAALSIAKGNLWTQCEICHVVFVAFYSKPSIISHYNRS